jgi:drug/metabolite transporter (DMT)-like permease
VIVHVAAVFAMIALSCGQIMLKLFAAQVQGVQGRIVDHPDAMLRLAAFLAALVGVYGVVFLLWIFVLRSLDLNRAFLYAALTFVFVPILSHFLLGEVVRPQTIIGAMIIVSGIAVSVLL